MSTEEVYAINVGLWRIECKRMKKMSDDEEKEEEEGELNQLAVLFYRRQSSGAFLKPKSI